MPVARTSTTRVLEDLRVNYLARNAISWKVDAKGKSDDVQLEHRKLTARYCSCLPAIEHSGRYLTSAVDAATSPSVRAIWHWGLPIDMLANITVLAWRCRICTV